MKILHLLFFVLLILLNTELNSLAFETAIKEKQKHLPDIYIVEKGDNLWNLSKKYMNDPFEWRNIWSKNKFITDPNLIFPGDPISFRKRKIIIPQEKINPAPIIKKTKVEPKIKIPVTSKEILASAGFIVKVDKPKGRVVTSLDEKLIMGKGDLIYIDIGYKNGSKEGKKYTIYKVTKQVIHPITKDNYGFLIKILGTIKIETVQQNMSMAVILQSYSEIEVNDKIMDYKDIHVPLIDPDSEKKKKEINAIILTTRGGRTEVGEGDIVYIDNGLSQGVMPGDKFFAFRFRGKESVGYLLGKNEILPKIIIGELKILSVREQTSTALITDTKQELEIGEKIKYKN